LTSLFEWVVAGDKLICSCWFKFWLLCTTQVGSRLTTLN